MKFSAKIKHLEKLAGLGQRCARCRLIVREEQRWKGLPGVEIITRICQDCGTSNSVPLVGTAHEREAFRLFYQSTDDDFYTDEKARAVLVWILNSPSAAANKKPNPANRYNPAPKQKLSKGARLRRELNEAVTRQAQQRRARLLAKYSKRFTEIDALGADMSLYGEAWAGKKPVEARGKLETTIWGAPLPDTIAELARLEREAQETTEAEAQRRAEEEQRNQELLERNRRTVAESRQPSGGADYSQPKDWWS
jgi:hypothetical protein